MLRQETDKKPAILYSCYFARSREGEQFIPEHVFSYQIAGTLTVNDGDHVHTFTEGDFRLSKRNHLAKFIKQPPEHGEFKSLSVYLDQETLKKFAIEYGYTANANRTDNAVVQLAPHLLYKSFMDSLLLYQHSGQLSNESLQTIKLREAIMLLLQINPELKDVLFDFNEPGKIDLEAFMEENFHFNVQIGRFAYLTGRSLATFKRDFEKIYHTSPSRWLQQRRLQEAHYLIKEKGKTPSDIYLEIGFEDLSHFSFAFKKMYGIAPSKIAG